MLEAFEPSPGFPFCELCPIFRLFGSFGRDRLGNTGMGVESQRAVTEKAGRTRLRWAALVVAAWLAAACDGGAAVRPSSRPASAPSRASEAPASPTEANAPLEPGKLDAPPPVTLRYLDKAAALHAWTYCYRNGCADGAPPADPLDVGSPEEVGVEFPLADWSFGATFTPAGQRCGREQQVRLERTHAGGFVVTPAGFAGTYDVTLFGRGEGDLFVTFRWTTPHDGPLAEPEASAAIVAGSRRRADSYGVELHLSNLVETPKKATARVTVEARDGHAVTFAATRSKSGCWPEGTVYWDGPDDKGLEAAALGDGPFEYTVEVDLDGSRHVATATWPDDEIRGYAPNVALEFTPPLPGLSERD
jgi:hypothetical protein